jgi:hypothetical protein
MRHSTVAPASTAENSKDGEESPDVSLGATSMVVCGALRSTLTVLVGSV